MTAAAFRLSHFHTAQAQKDCIGSISASMVLATEPADQMLGLLCVCSPSVFAPTGPLCCGYPLVCTGFASSYGFVWVVMICLLMLVDACPVCNGSAPGAL
jgi:hypothetical protein